MTTFTYNKGIPYTGTSLAGILGSIELPMVLLLATFILQEQVSTLQWMGAFFIILGIVIAESNSASSLNKQIIDN